MYKSENHIINKKDELVVLTTNTKNLYNKVNYIIRQEFINNGNWLRKFTLFTICKDLQEYKCMPARVSRCIIRDLDSNWKSFFNTIKDWKKQSEKYTGRPKLPKYLKNDKLYPATFIDNSILTKKNKGVKLSGLNIEIKPKTHKKIIEIKIIPFYDKFKINILFDEEIKEMKKNNNRYGSIDLGLNNLMTVTSNIKGLQPVIINGRTLKSINQYYNKKKAKLQSKKQKSNKLEIKKYNKINDYLHKSSRMVINWCILNEINTLIIGYNPFWKQRINLGKKTNQNFVNIPFEKLINMIQQKGMCEGISVLFQEESYTSKCSFFDMEEIKKHDSYMGKRIKRGLFETKSGFVFNADVNGSLNILKKAVPNVFAEGIEDIAVCPYKFYVL